MILTTAAGCSMALT